MAYSTQCRQKQFATYFHDNEFTKNHCNNCDNCVKPPITESVVVTEHARNLVICHNIITQSRLNTSIDNLAQMFRGAKTKAMETLSKDSHFGYGKGQFTHRDAKDLLGFLVIKGVFIMSGKKKHTSSDRTLSVLQLGTLAMEVLSGTCQPIVWLKRVENH